MLDVGNPDGSRIDTNFRITVGVANVTDDGIDISVGTWSNTIVNGYAGTWLAWCGPSSPTLVKMQDKLQQLNSVEKSRMSVKPVQKK